MPALTGKTDGKKEKSSGATQLRCSFKFSEFFYAVKRESEERDSADIYLYRYGRAGFQPVRACERDRHAPYGLAALAGVVAQYLYDPNTPTELSHQLTRTSAPALCFLSQSQSLARMGRHRARSYSKAPTHTHQPKPPVPSAPPALTHGEIWQLVCTAVNQPLPSPSCHCPVPATANLRPNLHQLMRNTFTPSPPHHLPSRHPPRSLG